MLNDQKDRGLEFLAEIVVKWLKLVVVIVLLSMVLNIVILSSITVRTDEENRLLNEIIRLINKQSNSKAGFYDE